MRNKVTLIFQSEVAYVTIDMNFYYRLIGSLSHSIIITITKVNINHIDELADYEGKDDNFAFI